MNKSLSKRQSVLFLLVTFSFTWICWLSLPVIGLDPADPGSAKHPAMLLWPLGQFGPTLAVLVLAAASSRTDRVKRPLLSCQWKPYYRSPAWYLVLLLPVLWMSPAWLYASLTPSAGGAGDAAGLPSVLSAFLPAVLFALGEEIGWRGFLLPQLLRRRSRLASSLIIGMIWCVWHLPILYLTSYESPLQFAIFLLGYAPTLLLWSVLLTWVFERTGRSIWMAVLLHGAFTATFNLLAPLLAGGGAAMSLLPLLVVLLLAGTVVLHDKPFWTTAAPV